MIRTLSKRGLNLEEYCRDKDQELKGVIDKRHFMYMLKQLRLPFTKKELLEVAQRYTLPSNHYAVAIDYESFIRDAGLAIKSSSMYGNECETLSGNEVVDLSIYSVVLMDVKRMILETARSLNKSHEDFHRMFARWDHEGVGSVTATQFLRVLARLQINLSDNDQDFLIELLDTNGMSDFLNSKQYSKIFFQLGMGRIDFESLLAFCLDDLENTIDNNRSPRFSEKSNFDKDNSLANFDEDVVMKRAVDNDDALKLSWSSHLSHGAPYKNSVNRMRPNTASSRISTSASQHLLTQNANSYTDSNENFLSVHSKQSNDAFLSHSNNPSSGTLAKQRPLTASARFPSGDAQARQKILSKEDEVDVPIDDGDDEGHNDRVTEQNTLGVGEYMENYYDVPFISTDSGKELPLDTPHSNVAYDYQDFGSLNDTTLITADQDHTSYVTGPLTDSSNQAYNLLSPPGHYQNSAPVASKEWPGLIRPQVKFVQAQYSHPFSNSDVVNGVHHDDKMIGKGETGQAAQNKNEFETKNHACEIYDMSVQINYDQNQMSAIHQQQQALELRVKLNNISKQIILKLRNFLIEKHLKGAKIYDLFELFVQSGRLFFDSVDLLNALAKLNISTSLAVTNIVIMHLAIDGKDKVSYGEFKVFVTDVDHKILEKLVLGQLAFQLERQGRVYEQLFRTCMTDSAIEVKSSKFSSQMNQIPYTNYLQSSYEASRKIKNNGMIGALEFQNALLKLGLKLNAHDLDRLSVRFDIHGGGLCAVSRFIDMVEGSTQWKQALSKVRIQEEAVAEAHILREKLRSQENATGYDNNNLSTCGHAGSQVMPTNVITEELLAMAEYLGIRPITEEHMLWIAADALRAPLPVSWSMMTDSRGRIYFYNQISKQSRWEHPLDPHFRKLRDDYRSM
jgi:Ca2+-binding EF-hand superfamily protein